MKQQMREMMDMAETEKERKAIHRCMQELGKTNSYTKNRVEIVYRDGNKGLSSLRDPVCGARKNHRALRTFPRFFRPRHQLRPRCISHCERSGSLPAPEPSLGFSSSTKQKTTPRGCCFLFGGEGGTRTLAPVTRPTPLAGAPRHQLEYFSIGSVFTHIHFADFLSAYVLYSSCTRMSTLFIKKLCNHFIGISEKLLT